MGDDRHGRTSAPAVLLARARVQRVGANFHLRRVRRARRANREGVSLGPGPVRRRGLWAVGADLLQRHAASAGVGRDRRRAQVQREPPGRSLADELPECSAGGFREPPVVAQLPRGDVLGRVQDRGADGLQREGAQAGGPRAREREENEGGAHDDERGEGLRTLDSAAHHPRHPERDEAAALRQRFRREVLRVLPAPAQAHAGPAERVRGAEVRVHDGPGEQARLPRAVRPGLLRGLRRELPGVRASGEPHPVPGVHPQPVRGDGMASRRLLRPRHRPLLAARRRRVRRVRVLGLRPQVHHPERPVRDHVPGSGARGGGARARGRDEPGVPGRRRRERRRARRRRRRTNTR